MTEAPRWAIWIVYFLGVYGVLPNFLRVIYVDLLHGRRVRWWLAALAGLASGVYWLGVGMCFGALAELPQLAAHSDAAWPKVGALSLVLSLPVQIWLALTPRPSTALRQSSRPAVAQSSGQTGHRPTAMRRPAVAQSPPGQTGHAPAPTRRPAARRKKVAWKWPSLRFPRPRPGKLLQSFRRGPPRVVTLRQAKDASGDAPPPRRGSETGTVPTAPPAGAEDQGIGARPAAARRGVQDAWEEIDEAFRQAGSGSVLRTGQPQNTVRFVRR